MTSITQKRKSEYLLPGILLGIGVVLLLYPLVVLISFAQSNDATGFLVILLTLGFLLPIGAGLIIFALALGTWRLLRNRNKGVKR